MMQDADVTEGIVLARRYRLGTGDGRGSLLERFSGPLTEVVRAHDLQCGCDVALKHFRPQVSSDPRFSIRFREQLKELAGLQHEALVTILDYGVDGDRFYIASEWVEGVNLRTYLAEYGALSPPVAVYVTRQICAALKTIHRAGVVHRGLKPENIFLTAEGKVRVADPGLSLLASESGLSRTTVMLGAVNTMSPEQARGQATGPPSDIYSLGVILFEMLTDRLPFEASDSWDVVRMHVQDPAPSLSAYNADAPPALGAIVETSLKKAPEERYATAEEMDAALAPLPQSDDLLWLVSPQHVRGLQGKPGGGLKGRVEGLGGWVEGLKNRLNRLLDGIRALDGEGGGEQRGSRHPAFEPLGLLADRLLGKLRLRAISEALTWRVASRMREDGRPALGTLLVMQFAVAFVIAFLFFYLLSGVVIGGGNGRGEAQEVQDSEDAPSAVIDKRTADNVATPTLAPTAIFVEQAPDPAPEATAITLPAAGAINGNRATGGQDGGGRPAHAGPGDGNGPPPHAGPPGGPPGQSGDKPGRGRGRP